MSFRDAGRQILFRSYRARLAVSPSFSVLMHTSHLILRKKANFPKCQTITLTFGAKRSFGSRLLFTNQHRFMTASRGHSRVGYLSSSVKAPPPHPHFVVELIIILACLSASFLWECILSLWPLLFQPLYRHTRSHARSHTNLPLLPAALIWSHFGFWGRCFWGHIRAAGPNDSRKPFLRTSPKIQLKLIWTLFWPSNHSLPEMIVTKWRETPSTRSVFTVFSFGITRCSLHKSRQ